MRSSKFLPNLGLSVLMISLAACAPKKHGSAGDDATFIVLPLAAQDVRVSGNESDLSVPRSSSFTVKACLQDAGLLQPVIDEEFTITEGPQSISRRTDSQGCLYWPETVSFNYLARESYVRLVRKFQPNGVHRGSLSIAFAMDPWKNSADGLVDLRNHPLDSDSLGGGGGGLVQESNALSAPAEKASTTFVQEVAVHTYDSQASASGTTLTAHLTLHPYLSRIALDSTEVREVLKKGSFTLELYLIERSRSERPVDDVLLARDEQAVNSEDGVINVVTRFALAKIPNPMSLIELGFRLTPQSVHGLGAQESMVLLDQLMQQSTLPVQPLTRPLDSYMAPSGVGPSGSAPGAVGLRFDSVRVDEGGVLEVSASTGMPKAIGIRVSVCMKDALNLRPIIDHPIEVKISASAKPTDTGYSAQSSDIDGCLYWQSKMSFDNYAGEKWFPRYLFIRSKRAPYQDVRSTFTVYIDPWQTGSLYYWDSRMGPPPSAPKPAPTRGPSSDSDSSARLQITELSYAYTGRDFEIDKYLNLTVKRRYQLRFKPVIFRPTSFSSGVAYDTIKHGHLNLKALLMTEHEPLSLFSGGVDIENGEGVADVVLPLDGVELPLVLVRNRLILELSDPEPGSSLKSAKVAAPFVASDAAGAIGLRPFSGSIDEITAQFETATDDLKTLAASGRSAAFRKKLATPSSQLFFS